MSTIESSSTELQPHQLREVDGKKLGCFRMFSIDGGHTEEITLSDMVLVQKVLCEGGVIIVDDWCVLLSSFQRIKVNPTNS